MGKFWKKLGRGLASPFKLAGGAVATAACGVAYAATAGQCKGVRKALKKTSTFTGKEFMESDIRHVGELAGRAAATAGCAVAIGATLGQCKGVNRALKLNSKKTVKSFSKASPVGQLAVVVGLGAACGAGSATATNAILGGKVAVGASAIKGGALAGSCYIADQVNGEHTPRPPLSPLPSSTKQHKPATPQKTSPILATPLKTKQEQTPITDEKKKESVPPRGQHGPDKSSQSNINIGFLPKVDLLRALWEKSTPPREFMGRMPPLPFDVKKAHKVVKSHIDYFQHRNIKSNISGDFVDPTDYDRSCGHGAFQRVVDEVRVKKYLDDVADGISKMTDELSIDEFMELVDEFNARGI